MLTTEQFLRLVEDSIEKQRISAKKFGVEALKDPNFVFDLRKGRSPSLNIVEKVLEYIEGTDERAA